MLQKHGRGLRQLSQLLAMLTLGAAMSASQAVSAGDRRLPLGLDLYRPIPENNPLTPQKVALGRRLFHERQLSRDGSLSCAGCHEPKRGFTTNLAVSVGVDGARGPRNVPTLINRAWGRAFFWDGRMTVLEDQVLQPLLNPIELATTPENIVAVARSPRYLPAFRQVFDRDPTMKDVGLALASYVRTIVAGDSPYDRYLRGQRSALNRSAARGLAVFRGKANCIVCHSGPTFTDEQFHNTGVAWRTGVLTDEGRRSITRNEADSGAFKTPTLRELPLTAPYMHDGAFVRLQAVVEFYDEGGAKNPFLDPQLRPLHLSPIEKADLVSFLRSLSGTVSEGW